MSIVLAAVDSSAATHPVLGLARELARLMGAEVEVVHVDEPSRPTTAATMARAAHLVLHERRGDAVEAIRALVQERDAAALVVGARGLPGGASPAGHVTTELVQALDVPVAVVPPQARSGPIERVLVAVAGDGESHALRHLVRHVLHGPPLEIIALHVFAPDRLPRFGDQPVLETEAWAEEFRRRALREVGGDVRTEARVGLPAHAIRRAVGELDPDLVVVAWHRDLGGGHGRIVRALLDGADVPVLLIPIARPATAAP